MKPSRRQTLRMVSILLATACGTFTGEEIPRIAMSPDLAPPSPELPDEENGIVRFERQLNGLDQATARSLADALEKLTAGTPAGDPGLFKKLEERHTAIRGALKAPARSPRRTEFPEITLYFQAFQGAEALARRSMDQGNRAAAMSYRLDMLEWSRVIRQSHPELIGYVIGLLGWRNAFGGMLRDWESHPDQRAGLAEIEHHFREFPCPWSELVPVFRREAQFWCDSGGTKGILEKLPRNQTVVFLLRQPFDKLTVADLLGLPYDEASEIRRQEAHLLGSIAAIRREAPLAEWPGMRPGEPAGRDLDAYRKRPNGLGDLRLDHDNGLYKESLALILFHQPAMETCLAWLKAEREGKAFNGDSPGVKPDPMTGAPLKIEPESRRIRSVGADLKFGKLDDSVTWPPGIVLSGDDRIVQVPAWRKDD